MDLNKALPITIEKGNYTFKILVYHLVFEIPFTLNKAYVHFMLNKSDKSGFIFSNNQISLVIEDAEAKKAVEKNDPAGELRLKNEIVRRENFTIHAKRKQIPVPNFGPLPEVKKIIVSHEVKEKKDFSNLMASIANNKQNQFLTDFIKNYIDNN